MFEGGHVDRWLVGFIAGWLVAAGAVAGAADLDRDVRERAVDALFAEFDRPGSPGAAIGVYHDGQVVYTKAYGYAELEHGVPITPQTIFNVASVSKQFTAFAIALLAREGKLDIDADIRTWLPYVPDFGRKITVRQLIHHTSGLRTSELLFELGGQDLHSVIHQRQVVAMVSRQRALNFEPGTEFLYSNTGYSLLAEIVAAASGRSFREFTMERIFRPLGMTHTFAYDDVTEIVPGRARSYEKSEDGSRWIRSVENYDVIGATGIMTNVDDLLKWVANFTHPVVGDAALIEQMGQSGKLNDGTPINYGFGLSRQRFAGHEAWTHTGSSAGYAAIFAYFPDHDFAVVLLMNSPADRYRSVDAIAGLYLNDAESGARWPADAVAAGPDVIKAAAGHYMSEFGPVITLVRDGDGLLWQEAGGYSTGVTFREDGTFDWAGDEREYYRFLSDDGARVQGFEQITIGSEHTPLLYRRVEPATPSMAQLTELKGDYFSPELDVTYTFTVEQGHLTARSLWSAEPIVFTPSVADRFDSSYWAMSTIAVVRDEHGRADGFRVHGYGIRNVLLRRLPTKSGALARGGRATLLTVLASVTEQP